MHTRNKVRKVTADRMAEWCVLQTMLEQIERARAKNCRISYPYYASWWIERPGCQPFLIGATFEAARRWIVENS
jgi:hypothetical protein